MNRFGFALCTYKVALNILLVSSVRTSTSSITSEPPTETSEITSKISSGISTNQENQNIEVQTTTPSLLSTSSNTQGYTDITTTNMAQEAEMTSEHFEVDSSPMVPLREHTTDDLHQYLTTNSILKATSKRDETSQSFTTDRLSTKSVEESLLAATTKADEMKTSKPDSTTSETTQLETTEGPSTGKNAIDSSTFNPASTVVKLTQSTTSEESEDVTSSPITTEGLSTKGEKKDLVVGTSEGVVMQTTNPTSLEDHTTKLVDKPLFEAITTEITIDKTSIHDTSVRPSTKTETSSKSSGAEIPEAVSTESSATDSAKKTISMSVTTYRQMDQTSEHNTMVEITTFKTTSQVPDVEVSELSSTKSTQIPKSELSTTESKMIETSQKFTTEGLSTKTLDKAMPRVTSQAAEVETSDIASLESYTTNSAEKSMFATSERAVNRISELVTTESTSEHPIDGISQQKSTENSSNNAFEITRIEVTSQTTDVRASQTVSDDTYATKSEMEKTSYPWTTAVSSTKALDGHRFEVTSQAADGEATQPTSIESHSTDFKKNPTSARPIGTISQSEAAEVPLTNAMEKDAGSTSAENFSTISGVKLLDESATTETLIDDTSQPVTESSSTKAVEKSTSQPADVEKSQSALIEGPTIKSESPMDQTSLPETTQGSPSSKPTDRNSEAAYVETSQPTSTETYSSELKDEPAIAVTSKPVVEPTSVPESTEGHSTKNVDRVMLETSSQVAEVITSDEASTEGHSTMSDHKPMIVLTTPERVLEKILQPVTTDIADRSTLEATAQLVQMEMSNGVSTKGHIILSTEASKPQTTSEFPIGTTLQPETGPLATAIDSVILETTSETAGADISDAASTQVFSTKSNHKRLLELTTPENIMDKTSQVVTTEISSTKAVDKPMLEATSRSALLKTSQPASTEKRSTKYIEEPLFEATSEPANLETSGPLDFTRGVTVNNVHTLGEGNSGFCFGRL